MAVAGRVAPVPKGDYDKNVAYKRLDCVKYLNVLYIAKKDVPSGTAITDENYWMKGIEGSDGGGSAVIDDTQSSTLTTYSSNKLDTLVSDINQSVEATNTNVDNIQKAVSDINNSLDHKINSDGNVSETVVNTLDSIPEERILPTVGDKIKVMFAKTVKYFQDLKTIAFTGDYEDLINKPTIPTLTNNLLATETGTALDAAQGTVVKSEIDSLKSGLANLEEDVSTLNSDNENARKEYKSLGSSKLSSTATQINLANSITNYKELLFWFRNSSGRIYASVTLPVSAFRAFNSVGRSIGLEVYLDRRVYTSIWYSSDTSVTSISSETNTGLYWQIIGLF